MIHKINLFFHLYEIDYTQRLDEPIHDIYSFYLCDINNKKHSLDILPQDITINNKKSMYIKYNKKEKSLSITINNKIFYI